jgi:heat shock protein HslJ
MEKSILYLFAIAAFSAFICACSSSKTNAKKLNGKWNISKVDGENISGTEVTPFLNFDISEKTVNGNVGCNIFNSTIQLYDNDAAAVTINSGQVTMMSCPDLQTEQRILQAIEKVKSVKTGNAAGEYDLCDANGNTVLTLTKGE